jgi:hypothetical protein
MKRALIYFIIIFAFFSNCQKKAIEPQNYFEAAVNNTSDSYKLKEAFIEKGITNISVISELDGLKKSIIITVNSDKPGKFHQYFDYKTGVSLSECGLVYEVQQSNDDRTPKYFKSIEGNVEIIEVNQRKGIISGFYNFRINSLSGFTSPDQIKGKFINLSIKRD